MGQSHPVIFSSFVVHTLCVFFKGSRFYFTLFHLHSSPVSIETIPCVPKYSMSLLLKPFEATTEYTVSFRFMCSIVSFYGIIYNWTFWKPSGAPFPTPSIRFAFVVVSPLFDLPFFSSPLEIPFLQSVHSWRSYELQITASRFMRSLIV